MSEYKDEINLCNNARKTDFYLETSALTAQAVSGLAVKIHQYKHKYGKKSILLTGCGTENGTTAVSVSLAATMAKAGYKTLLIDADMRTMLKRTKEKDGFYDLILDPASAEKLIHQTNIDNLHFLPGGKGPADPALLFCRNQAKECIKQFSDRYDFVIIDCLPITAAPDAAALFMSVDGIILVCALNRTTKKQLKNAKIAVEPYSDKYYGLIVNAPQIRRHKKKFPHF